MMFRKGLVIEKWLPDLTERGIPMTAGVMPLHMLADDTKKVRLWLGEIEQGLMRSCEGLSMLNWFLGYLLRSSKIIMIVQDAS